jgi:hypothetical protein
MAMPRLRSALSARAHRRAAGARLRRSTLGAMVRRGEFGMPGMSMEQLFDFGLDRILDGIETYCERR